MMLAVDTRSNPHGERPAARCEWCRLANGGLVLREGVFMHETSAKCTEAERELEAILKGDA